MEGVDINRVAQPFHPLAVSVNFRSGEGIDPPGGRVMPRQPFGIKQRQRTTLHRYRLFDTENMARDIDCVDGKTDCAGIGYVFWCADVGR